MKTVQAYRSISRQTVLLSDINMRKSIIKSNKITVFVTALHFDRQFSSFSSSERYLFFYSFLQDVLSLTILVVSESRKLSNTNRKCADSEQKLHSIVTADLRNNQRNDHSDRQVGDEGQNCPPSQIWYDAIKAVAIKVKKTRSIPEKWYEHRILPKSSISDVMTEIKSPLSLLSNLAGHSFKSLEIFLSRKGRAKSLNAIKMIARLLCITKRRNE